MHRLHIYYSFNTVLQDDMKKKKQKETEKVSKDKQKDYVWDTVIISQAGKWNWAFLIYTETLFFFGLYDADILSCDDEALVHTASQSTTKCEYVCVCFK